MIAKKSVLKYSSIALLICFSVWQGVLYWSSFQFSVLYNSLGSSHPLVKTLQASEYLALSLVVVFLLLAFDIWRRKEVLVMNVIMIILLSGLSCLVMQNLAIAGSYTPIMEVGK